MTDRIEPTQTLSNAQWERIRWLKGRGHLNQALLSMGTQELGLAGLIAAANEALPDSDPRKITPSWITLLRETANGVDGEWGVGHGDHPDTVALIAIADALEAYLPPTSSDVTADVSATHDDVTCAHCGRDRDHHVEDGRCWVNTNGTYHLGRTMVPGKTTFTAS